MDKYKIDIFKKNWYSQIFDKEYPDSGRGWKNGDKVGARASMR